MELSLANRALPGLKGGGGDSNSSSKVSKRPEDMFGIFDKFFVYFAEALEEIRRQKERESCKRENEREKGGDIN